MTVLFVITTVLLFLAVDWAIQRSRERRAAAVPARVAPRELSVRIPDGIFFAPTHTWLNLFPSGKASLGVDDFIARLLEKPGVALLRAPGETVSRGEPLLRLTSDGHALTVRSPIDCEILSANGDLEKKPALLEEGLFSDGWAYQVRPVRSSDVKDLLLGNESRRWIRTEYQRLKDLLSGAVAGGPAPAFLQEGGPPVAGVLNDLGHEVWERLEAEFLAIPD